MSALSTALAFCRHGHAVLPLCWPAKRDARLVCSCRRGADCGITAAKHPFGQLAPNGLLSATTDPGIVKSWFGVQALDANLGVRTDKLVVVDADRRHGGGETLAALEREHPFPPTWRVQTGGGGEHVFFCCPDNVTVPCSQAQTNPVLGPGIDIRARGGYVVAPPSRHISGRIYAWSVDHHPRDVALADAPPWLIERLAARLASNGNAVPVRTPESEWERICSQPITEYQDAAAAKLAGRLLRYHDPLAVLGLMQCWNATRCSPPLSDTELYRIVNRIAARELQRQEALYE